MNTEVNMTSLELFEKFVESLSEEIKKDIIINNWGKNNSYRNYIFSDMGRSMKLVFGPDGSLQYFEMDDVMEDASWV